MHSFCIPRNGKVFDLEKHLFLQTQLALVQLTLAGITLLFGSSRSIYMKVFGLAVECCLGVNIQQPWIVAGKRSCNPFTFVVLLRIALPAVIAATSCVFTKLFSG